MIGAYFDKIRHTLISHHLGELVIIDPIGYESANEEFTRTFDKVGILANFSADLKFVGDGRDYINNIIKNYGINEVITIRREEKDPYTDEWLESYTSTLDLSTYNDEKGQISIKINAGGLDKIFKSRESEKIEIENTKDLDGNDIDELPKEYLNIQGREIFLKTRYEVKPNDNSAKMLSESAVGNKRGHTITVPLVVESQSHDNANSPMPNTIIEDNSDERTANGVTGLMFFANSDRFRNLRIKLEMSFKLNNLQYDDIDWATFRLRFAKYYGGVDYIFRNDTVLYFTDNIPSVNGQTITVNWDGNIFVNQGESLSLQFTQLMEGDDGHDNHLEIDCVDIVSKLWIDENSSFEPSQTQMILVHDLGERLTKMISGKDGRFQSNILGKISDGYAVSGKWAHLATYSGQWLRGFSIEDFNPDDPDNRYKKFTTSFKDYISSLRSMFNLHYGFQRIGNQEKVIVEDFEYFFNPNIVLTLPTPLSNVKRYIAEDFIFSSAKMGYEKGTEVEGIQGLDEPNGQTNWVSNIVAVNQGYEHLSKFIAGNYMEEKQRRYQKISHPNEDTDYDKDIFIKDCIMMDSVLRERVWQDDYLSAPTGIYSPSTIKNLRLSPAQNLRRHKTVLNSPLKHYQDKFLSFGSATGNSAMSNYLPTETISENENIQNSRLGNRIFEPYYIEGEHLVSGEIMRTLKANSVFNGIEVPNFYCKIQFTIEDEPEVLRYGYLMSLKPGGQGSWKFIESSNISI